MSKSDRGFASMDDKAQREAASKGGQTRASNAAHRKEQASEAGKKGAAAQPVEAKVKGGKHSHLKE